jgi:transcriptional regulator with XRE-family HTH domain
VTTVRFGERMRALRKERGWSAREASRRLGVEASYVRKIENLGFLPKDDRLEQLAQLYGLPKRKLNDWLVADRLTAETGERAPGVSWFTRSLEDLPPAAQRQALSRLLAKLAERQGDGDPWPDEFQIRQRGGGGR